MLMFESPPNSFYGYCFLEKPVDFKDSYINYRDLR